MNVEDELRHIRSGPRKDERQGERWLLRVRVDCEQGNAPEVLARAKQVLTSALECPEIECLTRRDWERRLPDWFVEAIQRPDAEGKSYEVTSWTYWMKSANREWFWWDTRLHTPRQCDVYIVGRENAEDPPFAWYSLEWLLTLSGATDVEMT